ncbi:MAG: helix-hairpin-helix domain-containing protein, partial [Planctomycetota bacterium]
VAIRVFSENLRQLLMAPPLGAKRVLGVDPGFRTGCKVVCLDEQGKLLCEEVIYPHPPAARVEEARRAVTGLLERHRIEFVAVGNGTAGRETEAFLRGVVGKTPIVMVNESGASIYSASDVAREEFPDHDLTVRGAVSIGRRLADPLAELVKIDAKSIGVGQYQHDVDQGKLKRALDDVVMSCVNGVGVEVNTASRQLLAYVSGLGPQLAANIVKHRDGNGPFRTRRDLLKVPRLGPKAFEQAAGFLRIRGGDEPLDASAVHPESYGVVARMGKDAGCSIQDLMGREEARARIDPARYVTETVGLPTLQDILVELGKPGRDPRERFETVTFAEGISTLEDLKPGLVLTGVVTNVAAFGAFVDVGVHQDGLVHVSQLADRFVKDPHEVVKVGQRVTVTVLEVDLARKRVSLSMKRPKS